MVAARSHVSGWDLDDLRGLAARLGLTEPLKRFARGSVYVGCSGDQVVKIFPPGEESYALVEVSALTALHGVLPIPTPLLHESGVFEEHTFVRMSRLRGKELIDVWPSLTPDDRIDLARQLGEALAVLHGMRAPIALDRPDWSKWVERSRASAVQTQIERGTPEALARQIPAFLDDVDLSEGRGSAFLHTEVMRDHLLVQQTEDGWRLSGLFDFEPAMVLPRDYELASVGVFFAGGDPAVLRAVLDGMGRPVEAGLSRRLMGMLLMHRYSNLKFALERTRAAADLGLDTLADLWFGT